MCELGKLRSDCASAQPNQSFFFPVRAQHSISRKEAIKRSATLDLSAKVHMQALYGSPLYANTYAFSFITAQSFFKIFSDFLRYFFL